MAPIPATPQRGIRREGDRIRFVGIHPVNVPRAVRFSPGSSGTVSMWFKPAAKRLGEHVARWTASTVAFAVKLLADEWPFSEIDRTSFESNSRKKHDGVGNESRHRRAMGWLVLSTSDTLKTSNSFNTVTSTAPKRACFYKIHSKRPPAFGTTLGF